MPVGLGTFAVSQKAASAIAGVKVGPGADGMARAAVEAVQKLATADGHPIRGFKPAAASGSSGGGSSALIFGVPVALLILGLAIVSYRRLGSDEEDDDNDHEAPA
jgi:hypothetical protein